MSVGLDEVFSSIIKGQEAREARFLEGLSNLPSFENCPRCGTSNQLDRDLSLESFEATYPCKLCATKARERKIEQRLQSWKIPNRLLKASFEFYKIYDPDQTEMIDRIHRWMGEWNSKPLLYLGGTCGTGKGHIAAAIIRHLMPKGAYWVSQAKLMSEYHAASFSEKDRFLKRLEKVPFLVIDELGGVAASKDTPELFFRILDERLDWNKPTIMTGNLRMQAVFEVIGGARMADRFTQSGEAIKFDWESYRMRKAQAEKR